MGIEPFIIFVLSALLIVLGYLTINATFEAQNCTTKIIYRNVQKETTIDDQFSPNNFPSVVFQPMFEQPSPQTNGIVSSGVKSYIIPQHTTAFNPLSYLTTNLTTGTLITTLPTVQLN